MEQPLRSTMQTSSSGSSIEFERIQATLTTKTRKNGETKKTILDNVSGNIAPARFCAIMGPSGSGKTSLLNCIAGRTKVMKGLSLTGVVKVNGVPLVSNSDWSKYRRLCAYVEQDDLLFHTLTVRETLMFAAQMRLPRHFSYEERSHAVDNVLGELGLRGCQHTRIGNEKVRGVSGGERKRVSIALEILRGPKVLFLDECTTGLDSFQALKVTTTIKDLARSGRTMVSSIHQPRSSIFSLFDDIIILSEGKIMYAGEASKMVDYFASVGYALPKNFNPADFVIDIVSLDVRTPAREMQTTARIQALSSEFQNRRGGLSISTYHDFTAKGDDDLDIPVHSKDSAAYTYEATMLKQFMLLTQRAIRQKMRDRTQWLVPFLTSLFFGLLLGFMYFQTGDNLTQKAIFDKNGLLFFIALNQAFQGFMGVVGVFPHERSIINRERASKSFSLLPYYSSKFLTEIPMMIFPWFFVTIVYFLAALKPQFEPYMQTCFVCMLGYFSYASFGLVISALSSSSEMAQGLGMPILLIFVLFSGFYANTDLIPVALSWIQWLSPVRYVYAAFVNIYYRGVVFECTTGSAAGCIPNGEAFVERLGLQYDSFERSMGILLGYSAGLQILGYIILRLKKTRIIVPKST